MIRALSVLSHLLLLLGALALGLAVPGGGVMAGTGPAAGKMVLCTGTGPLTVWVDAQGRPLPAPDHPCPKCHASAPPLLLPGQVGAPQPLALPRSLWRAPAALVRPVAVFHRPQARAPPMVM